jgi:hypothetical protein
MGTPFFALYGSHPSYHDLRAFDCTCYPNLTATSLCAFIGYSPDHKGYRCLDLATNRVIVSRHVVFDETMFPFSLRRPSPPPQELDFLTNDDTMPVSSFSAGPSRLADSLSAPASSPASAQSMGSLGTPTSRTPPPGFPVLGSGTPASTWVCTPDGHSG